MNKKSLYIVDAHALIYRSYYAFIRNPLINSNGQPTSAVFGFANYLIRLIESYECPYIVVVMDSGTPTFRHTLYAQYKANREEMPGELRSQLPLIKELIEAMNLPVVKKDGLEADDLIGVLTNRALEDGFDEVFLVTKDKDLMQLVGPRVKMLAPEGTGTLQLMGTREVKEKLGIGPELIPDYLALIGDSSDNIPGVPGIGPKTAVKILDVGGTVERILEDPSILKNPKLIQKIEDHREVLKLSRLLATLKSDVALPVTSEDLKRRPVNRERSVALFRELEFTSLVRHPLFISASKSKVETRIPSDMEELVTFIRHVQEKGYVAIDIQTTCLVPRDAGLVGIALAISPENALYIPLDHTNGENFPPEAVMEQLKSCLESGEIQKIGQNLKFEYEVLKNYGFHLKGLAFDTMVAAYLIDPGKRNYDMDVLAAQWLNIEFGKIEALVGKGKKQICFSEVPVEQAAHYAGEMAALSLALKEKLEPVLLEKNAIDLFRNVEIPLISVLGDMEWNGILIDRHFLEGLSEEYLKHLDELSDSVFQITGEALNLNSPKQIGEVLFERLSLPTPKKTKTGNHSTNVEVLEKLAPQYPVVQKILEYREVQKLLSTYIDALPNQILPVSGRVHSSFNQTITATGRLSSTNPNLQNIPIRTEAGRAIRNAFIANEGWVLISADYSQIELRILAHLSQDPLLIQAFAEDKDIHTQTASAIYGVFPQMVTDDMRRAAKTINFGLMYGMGPHNLSQQLGTSYRQAKEFITAYFRQFPTIKAYMEKTIEKVREFGYAETLLGRRRYLPEIGARNRIVRDAAERTAINTPVQGTAADIIKIAMIAINGKMITNNPNARLLLQVHDELVFEVPQEGAEKFAQWVVQMMANAFKLIVPIKVEVGFGKRWSDAH